MLKDAANKPSEATHAQAGTNAVIGLACDGVGNTVTACGTALVRDARLLAGLGSGDRQQRPDRE